MSIYFYMLLLLFIIIFLVISKLPCLYVKRFELRKETALYKNKFIIIIILHCCYPAKTF